MQKFIPCLNRNAVRLATYKYYQFTSQFISPENSFKVDI